MRNDIKGGGKLFVKCPRELRSVTALTRDSQLQWECTHSVFKDQRPAGPLLLPRNWSAKLNPSAWRRFSLRQRISLALRPFGTSAPPPPTRSAPELHGRNVRLRRGLGWIGALFAHSRLCPWGNAPCLTGGRGWHNKSKDPKAQRCNCAALSRPGGPSGARPPSHSL